MFVLLEFTTFITYCPTGLFNVVTSPFVFVPVPYKYIFNVLPVDPLSKPLQVAKNNNPQ